MSEELCILPDLRVPRHELRFTATRSSGPGGQHVNKVSSRVTLHFDVRSSPSLDETQRRRLYRRLATRINKRGVLALRCQRHRSQAANREELIRRFTLLLREALRPVRRRKPTRPRPQAAQRRVEEKRRRGRLKRARTERGSVDD